jgi:asparagine synthase (glutamine-hydrolysing)
VSVAAFLCALPKDGDGLSPAVRRRVVARAESAVRGAWEWVIEPGTGAAFGVVSGAETARTSVPAVVSVPGGVLVGSARLDDPGDGSCDLVRMAAAVRAHGTEAVRGLLGDFAFVYWDAGARRIIAGRDVFGVRTLYRRELADAWLWSSSASALIDREDYDPEYAAEFLLNGYDPSDRTPYLGVRAVPAGSVASVAHGVLGVRQYWSVGEFAPAADGAAEFADTAAVVAEFRRLFERSVATRLRGDGDGRVWSMLSGGLDSSSIVSMAGVLVRQGEVPQGLGGAVSFVDSYDDEGAHQRAVAHEYGVRHESVVDDWLWRDDGGVPPMMDEPHTLYGFYARNRRFCDLVRCGGANVLLCGTGPDHYLAGSLSFFADWVARGEWARAVRELARWAVLANMPFWRFATECAVMPLLPLAVRRAFAGAAGRTPSWFQPAFARRWSVRERTAWRRGNAAPGGRLYAGEIEFNMGHIPPSIDRGEFEDGIEMRYPFLDRRLVEFSLGLPRELRTQPHARKWIQREGMRGVLPESVRMRRSKGGITGRTRWSLQREHAVVADLLRDPIVAELGYVDRDALLANVERARVDDDLLLFEVVRVLSFETWLRVRTGRWQSRGAPTGADREELLPA